MSPAHGTAVNNPPVRIISYKSGDQVFEIGPTPSTVNGRQYVVIVTQKSREGATYEETSRTTVQLSSEERLAFFFDALTASAVERTDSTRVVGCLLAAWHGKVEKVEFTKKSSKLF